MNQEELYRLLVEITDVEDFVLELKQSHSSTYWGRYFVDRKLIRLYALDENGEPYPDEILIREGLHEITHHIQHNHIPFWKRKKGIMHDSMFWEIYHGMLKQVFGEDAHASKRENRFVLQVEEAGLEGCGDLFA